MPLSPLTPTEARDALEQCILEQPLDFQKAKLTLTLFAQSCDVHGQNLNDFLFARLEEPHPFLIFLILNMGVGFGSRKISEDGQAMLQLMETYLNLGGNIDTVNHYGSSALHYACARNHLFAAQLLIRHGANPNLKDFNDNTLLHHAVILPDPSMTTYILSLPHFTEHEATDKYGHGALQKSLRMHSCAPAARKLIAKGIGIHQVLDTGGPLHWIAMGRDPGLSLHTALIQAGVSLRTRNSEGKTALELAAEHNDQPFVQLLIEVGYPSDFTFEDVTAAYRAYQKHTPFSTHSYLSTLYHSLSEKQALDQVLHLTQTDSTQSPRSPTQTQPTPQKDPQQSSFIASMPALDSRSANTSEDPHPSLSSSRRDRRL